MKFGLSDSDLKLILDEIIKHLGETTSPEIYIFGSRAKGNYRPYSDIDLLLKADSYGKKSLSNIDLAELNTPYKVDFVLDKDLYDAYRDDIESHMICLWRG